jgi:hypothetical protein
MRGSSKSVYVVQQIRSPRARGILPLTILGTQVYINECTELEAAGNRRGGVELWKEARLCRKQASKGVA